MPILEFVDLVNWNGTLIVGGVVTLLALAWFLVLPLLIVSTIKFSTNPKFEAVTKDTPMPLSAKEFFRDTGEDLRELGFKYRSTLIAPNITGNVTLVFQFFVHPQNLDCAMGVIGFATAGGTFAEQSRYVEFDTKLSNGHEVTTNNTHEINAFEPAEDVTKTTASWIDEVDELYAAHNKILSEQIRGARKVLAIDSEFGGDVKKFIINDMVKELSRSKRMKLSSDGQHYVPTTFGGYMICWTQMPPFSIFASGRRDRLARNRIEA